MKKYIFLFALVLALAPFAKGEGIVPDYYLYNREHAVMKERINILPNTLRLVIFEGETASLRADVTPDGSLSQNLSWRIVNGSGAAEIYPSGGSCAVFGKSTGKDTVEISLVGKSVNVEVEVKPPQVVEMRSFELEREKEVRVSVGGEFYAWAKRSLICLFLGAFFAFVILVVKKVREKK